VVLKQFQFNLAGEKISEEVLVDFEGEIGGTLDTAYRHFLLSVNGGVPSPALISSLPSLPFRIPVFYKLVEGYYGLRRMFHDCNETSDRRSQCNEILLPIASDTGQREICVSVGPPEASMFLYSYEDPDFPIIEPLHVTFAQFVASLSQPEEPIIAMEVLASKSWEEIQAFLNSGGRIDSIDGELSLLCQSIRCDKPELFDRLMDMGVDITDAVEVAVINNRLSMLKKLIFAGGDAVEALDLAVGPQRKEMREFLRGAIGS
jgi:SMI1-KNR4 cell-wall